MRVVRPIGPDEEGRAVLRAFGVLAIPDAFMGAAAFDDGEPIAVGIVAWNRHGQAEGYVSKKKPVSAITMHRLALRTLGILKALGETAIYVACDETIPGARKWLERLGFGRRPELKNQYNQETWVWPA